MAVEGIALLSGRLPRSPEELIKAIGQAIGAEAAPSHEDQIADMRSLAAAYGQTFAKGDVITPSKASRLSFAGEPCIVIESRPEDAERHAGVSFFRRCGCGTHYEMDSRASFHFEPWRPKEPAEAAAD